MKQIRYSKKQKQASRYYNLVKKSGAFQMKDPLGPKGKAYNLSFKETMKTLIPSFLKR